jgi:hypothetical protein
MPIWLLPVVKLTKLLRNDATYSTKDALANASAFH